MFDHGGRRRPEGACGVVIEALETQNDIRFESHVLRDGSAEWEHVNIICLERKEGRASKILFIRQNVTELKKREMQIQAEMSLADRKERQCVQYL